jgi:hypothetical protein
MKEKITIIQEHNLDSNRVVRLVEKQVNLDSDNQKFSYAVITKNKLSEDKIVEFERVHDASIFYLLELDNLNV